MKKHTKNHNQGSINIAIAFLSLFSATLAIMHFSNIQNLNRQYFSRQDTSSALDRTILSGANMLTAALSGADQFQTCAIDRNTCPRFVFSHYNCSEPFQVMPMELTDDQINFDFDEGTNQLKLKLPNLSRYSAKARNKLLSGKVPFNHKKIKDNAYEVAFNVERAHCQETTDFIKSLDIEINSTFLGQQKVSSKRTASGLVNIELSYARPICSIVVDNMNPISGETVSITGEILGLHQGGELYINGQPLNLIDSSNFKIIGEEEGDWKKTFTASFQVVFDDPTVCHRAVISGKILGPDAPGICNGAIIASNACYDTAVPPPDPCETELEQILKNEDDPSPALPVCNGTKVEIKEEGKTVELITTPPPILAQNNNANEGAVDNPAPRPGNGDQIQQPDTEQQNNQNRAPDSNNNKEANSGTIEASSKNEEAATSENKLEEKNEERQEKEKDNRKKRRCIGASMQAKPGGGVEIWMPVKSSSNQCCAMEARSGRKRCY